VVKLSLVNFILRRSIVLIVRGGIVGSSSLMDLVKKITSRHEVMTNEVRVLILALLDVFGEMSWSSLKEQLEKVLGVPVNPNLLAFHLRRLLGGNYIVRRKIGREVFYEINPDYRRSISEELGEVKEKLREVLGK